MVDLAAEEVDGEALHHAKGGYDVGPAGGSPTFGTPARAATLSPLLVSILIPCHDEEEALPALFAALDRLPGLLRPRHFPEIVLVDDGSTDRSVERLYDYADRALMPVRVLGLEAQGGIGNALREGAALVAGEAVVTYDADLPYPIEDVPRLVGALEAGAEVATASPWHPAGGSEGLGARRSALSRAASRLYRLRLRGSGQGIHTFTCGFRAWRREAFLAALPRRSGFTATAEMLLNALRDGRRAAEIPSTLRVRTAGRSKMRVLRTALAHLGLLLRG